MARISGVDLPREKRIEIGLTLFMVLDELEQLRFFQTSSLTIIA